MDILRKGTKGGLFSPKRLSKGELLSLRKEVIDKRWRCDICYKLGVEIHEVKPRSKSSKNSAKIFRHKNMIKLCPSCHRRWHTDKKFRKANEART